MTTDILSDRDLEWYVSDWTMVPTSGGVFSFEVNGEVLFSKKALGRHAEPGEIRQLFAEKVAAYKATQPDP